MADDVICVQLKPAGKWHVAGAGMSTACGETIKPGDKQRYLSLVLSFDRCKNKGCVDARLAAKGIAP